MTDDWPTLRQKLEQAAFYCGVANMARMIPADRATVYRMINGQVEPIPAMKECVKRAVQRVSHMQQSSDSED